MAEVVITVVGALGKVYIPYRGFLGTQTPSRAKRQPGLGFRNLGFRGLGLGFRVRV